MQTCLGITLSCSLLILSGCGSRTADPPKKSPAKAMPAGDTPSVTLHVAGMTERLKLT
jgi:hypothetical protein